MPKWFVDKNSKVPLYLQLKDLIRYYISTGVIQEDQQLPTVSDLASQLEVNFETIRKAYKELERESFISSRRGKGTFVTPRTDGRRRSITTEPQPEDPVASLKAAIKMFIQSGTTDQQLTDAIARAVTEARMETAKQSVVFTECNELQVKDISELLRSSFPVNIKPVLLADLRREVQNIFREGGDILAVLTTGFHVNEVNEVLSDIPVRVDFLITNMSPETRRVVEQMDKNARFGFICRDREDIPLYTELLAAELGLAAEPSSCILDESDKLETLLNSTDAILASPPVYDEVKRLAPEGLPVFNVFNRVDPMSLRVVKDRILSRAGLDH